MPPSAVIDAGEALPASRSAFCAVQSDAQPAQPAQPVQPAQPTPEPSLLNRSLLEEPHNVKTASGSYLYLRDGRPVLDACGGAAVAILGHGNTEVIHAAAEQMQRVAYVHTLAYGTDAAEKLAHAVLHFSESAGSHPSPHGLVKAFFVGSGSEANESALKCARQYWHEQGQPQRRYFVARRQAYHGNTLGAMSVSDLAGRKAPYTDVLLPSVSFVSAADGYHGCRAGETEEAQVARLAAELEAEFLRLGPENVISFIGETVSGASLGAMAAPAGYWPAMRAVCDKYGILLHLDEVMCGSGRTGTYFAFTQEGIQPDIVTIGKGLGGGYAPIAGMLVNGRIVDGLRRGTAAFNHGHTYQAHPVSCAAALAVQRVLQRDGLVARVAARGPQLGRWLDEAFADCAHVGDIRGRGFFWAVEFVQDKQARTPFPRAANVGPRVQQVAFAKGVAVYPGAGTADGHLGDHALLAPPYTASDEELRLAVATLRAAYDDVIKEVLGLVCP